MIIVELLPTITLYWTVGGELALGRPLAGIANPTIYSEPISTEGADQIGLFVYTTSSGGGTDGNIYIRIAWAGIVRASGVPTTFVEECVEVPGASGKDALAAYTPGVSFQRFSLSVKEFGPFTTSPPARGTVWIPVGAHFFKIGCYSDAVVTSNAAVTVIIERARTGAPVGTARTF
jgi:hypothetical protein